MVIFTENPYTFTGRRFDEESGMYHFHYRQYDTATGVWTTPDPIGLLGGINFYAYVQNNPVNFWDWLGLTLSAGEAGVGNPGSYGGENTSESMGGTNGAGTGNSHGSENENSSTTSFSIVDLNNVFGPTDFVNVPEENNLMAAVEQSLKMLEDLSWTAAWAASFVPGGQNAGLAFAGMGLLSRTMTRTLFPEDPRDSYWDLIDDTTSAFLPGGAFGPAIDKYKGIMLDLTRDALERDSNRAKCHQ